MFGKNSVRYLGPIILNPLPWKTKSIRNLSDFKESIKKGKLECPCKIGKTYNSSVGFASP